MTSAGARRSPLVAKVAVSAATYWVDRPYDYLVPREWEGCAAPGMRVRVPFGRGNRRSEGVILALRDASDRENLKTLEALLDETPLLTQEQIRLGMWMRERYFSTVYDSLRAMLPAGLWFNEAGARRVKDKYQNFASLTLPAEEAMILAGQKRRSAPQQASLLETLCAVGSVPELELRRFTGASLQSLRALERAGLVELTPREVFRRPEYRRGEPKPLPELNPSQEVVLEGLWKLAASGEAQAALLYGVTGSGKTAVYAHLIRRALDKGGGTILLVPEIALTPQMLEIFSGYFGEDVAVLHSSLSLGERCDEWKRIRSGKARVVVGTRSAVFAPVENLRLILMDEEHEESYKSENTPRYHAREVAQYRCAHSNGLLVLGSATPDITTSYSAQKGKYHCFSLRERYNAQALPEVRIVDMKRELRAGRGGSISSVLEAELRQNLDRGEQSILFLNRRGASKLIACTACGYTYQCPNCSVSLTYHSANRRLMCHHCGHSQPVDKSCPVCGGKLRYDVPGTQKVEAELRQIFPDTEILRMDADTVALSGGHDAILERFRAGGIPILLGTQMVARGLNFEDVTLVGVLSADQSLYAGDYRAAERTFSLLTQVVGRSGRGSRPGRAVIQTFTPDNQVIRQAAAQDYPAFYREELRLRRIQGTPPFSRLYAVTASGLDEAAVLRCCVAARDMLQSALAGDSAARVLGPAPLFVTRVNNRYRYRVTLCAPDAREYRRLISAVLVRCNTDKSFRGVSVFGDTDPND